MLRHIHIRHFAIVDELALDFSSGLTVFTGETGAGKSILIDALGLALGDRAESGTIRPGAERAEVSAEFDINSQAQIQAWLREQELDEDGQCLIRRTFNTDGRSKGYINGHVVPMQSLRELGEQLVDIHGQHAHQSLLKRKIQRQALDDYAGHNALVSDIAAQYGHWQELRDQLNELQLSREQRDDRLGLLRYQVQELQQLDLSIEELAELETEHQRLANLNQLRAGGESAFHILNENPEGALNDTLEQLAAEIEQLAGTDPGLKNISETLQGAAIQAREAGNELRNYLDGLELDPDRLQWVDERLGLIHDLARKHRIPPEQLPELLLQLETELATLENAEVHLEEIAVALEQAEQAYRDTAAKLSASRKAAAEKLARAVSKNMHQLGMPHGEFSIQLDPVTELSPNGLEQVEFHVTTNPGQPPQALSKVASGGELARISLAIQVIAAGTGRIPTLIFDEVDVGIGGGIAEVVGRLLRNLSDERQVMCVTHQPQVASLAHHHLQVRKQSDKQQTSTDVTPVSEQDRVNEIARMLGGLEITEQTLSHAREMIDRGQQPLS